MTRYIYFLMLGLALTLNACGGGDDTPVAPETPDKPDTPDKPAAAKTVTFTTDVFTRSVVTELGEAAEMNVYAKDLKSLEAEDVVDGVLKSVNKGGVWNTTPEIKIKSDQKAFLYAVYPFSENHTNPSAIPVDANKQIDYLYSGEGVVATYDAPSAKLTMSHALAVMSFNVCKGAYAGLGKLQGIKVQGEKFPTTGLLNIHKGNIKIDKPGVLSLTFDKQINATGWTEGLPQTFTLPVESNGSNILVILTIDGKEYTTALPVIKIEQGYRYIFRLGLSDSGLIVFAADTQKISLKQESDEMPVDGVSSLKFNFVGKTVILPEVKGKSLRPGLVNWGDKSSVESYLPNATHTYLDKVAHDINIECWNAEEVVFSSMKGIKSVDLSKF